MAVPNPNEMEEMQKMSDKYQPDLPGPLIGDKLPISDLVQEYARADPTYIAKTQALASTHVNYRRVKGDGQCGWRGVVFRYFEIIAESNDHGLAVQELTRVRSFEETMKMAGVDYELLEDFFEETWELFRKIVDAFEKNNPAMPLIIEVFNDDNRSNAIVYHFKMMTSSYMALHPDDFEPFLEMPLDQYRQARIDPTNQEIDQIGLQALSTGVIAPAGLAVEVLYLDRSAGDEVTPHEFIPGGDKKPVIRLLYRPGHYDLIYKLDPNFTVMTVTASGQRAQNYQQIDETFLNERYYEYLFPGATHLDPQFDSQYPYNQSPASYSYQPQPAFPPAHVWDPSSMYTTPQYSMPPTQPSPYHQAEPPAQVQTPAYYPSSPEMYQPSPPGSIAPSTPGPTGSIAASSPGGPPIRHSEFSSAIRGPRRVQHANIPLNPRSFGSSSQSRAHFTNSDFEPEAWDPKSGK